jgi:3-methylfumaryl-CoA hydratase
MDFDDWAGRSETVSYGIDAVPYAAMSALLTSPARWPGSGTPLPALWHWLYRMPLCQALLPPGPHAAWSWVGCRIRVHATVRIGDTVTRSSSIVGLPETAGDPTPSPPASPSQVTLRHVIHRAGDERAAITEDHDIVLGDVQWSKTAQPLQAATEPPGRRRWDPYEFRTFRHAALAFDNARCHGAPTPASREPVAEGPLVAMLMEDVLHHRFPDATLVSFRARTVRPLHDFVPFFLHSRPGRGASTTELWAEDHRGRLAMAARAIVR